jgi:hypothetical protein
LSIILNHFPPLTPLPSADTMRSVQTEASIQRRSWRFRISVPCIAVSGTPGTLSCFMSNLLHPTSCLPSLRAVLLAAPPCRSTRQSVL